MVNQKEMAQAKESEQTEKGIQLVNKNGGDVNWNQK